MLIGADILQPVRIPEDIRQLTERAAAPLAGNPPHLGMLFISNHFEDELETIVAEVRQRTGVVTLVGCTGEGVCGPSGEVERRPAIALWLAHLPGVQVTTFQIDQTELESAEGVEAFREMLDVAPAEGLAFLVMADPYSFHIVQFLERAAEAYPLAPVSGGMASGSEAPGQTRLVWDDQVFSEGAVGVALRGNIRVEPIVSQGCRPVGKPFVITAAEQNVIKLLGGKPAMAMLRDVFQSAALEDKKLMEQGVFLGQVIDEYKSQFDRGDFLIRNMIGGDHQSGALVIGDHARVGRTIQFHVRDARTADEDLRTMLAAAPPPAPSGALLFTCNGRGTRLFPQASHDVRTLREILGEVPVAGLFCAGELGPIGQRNFIHGHTASMVLLRPGDGE